MNYLEVITADRTWVCPKSGIYKIIAVGGGSACSMAVVGSGSAAGNFNTMAYQSGDNTSFGDLLTANGGVNAGIILPWGSDSQDGITAVGGSGGYTLEQYGGVGAFVNTKLPLMIPPTLNGGTVGKTGSGYGAGGGAGIAHFKSTYTYTTSSSTSSSSYTLLYDFTESSSGDVNELICDIEEGRAIACAIGSGGCWTQEKLEAVYESITDKMKEKLATVTAKQPEVLPYLTPGRSGCIVVQYISESL